MVKQITTPTRIAAIRHKDKRPNIPTEELRDFVADELPDPRYYNRASHAGQCLRNFKCTIWPVRTGSCIELLNILT